MAKEQKKKSSKKKPSKKPTSSTEWTFKEWYDKNKQTLNSERKRRYKNDPDYRKTILDSQRKRRAEIRKNIKKKAKKRTISRRPKPRIASIRGDTVLMLSTGQVIEQIGVSKVTLMRWIKSEFIPSYYLRDDKNRRWFPEYFVKWLVEVVTWREEQRLCEDRSGRAWFLDDQQKIIRGRWMEKRKFNKWPTAKQLKRMKVTKLEKPE